MYDLKYVPISCVESFALSTLMKEEENAWMHDLGWDYSPIRKILVSFINQNLLPGYVALSGPEAIGYTYFLMNGDKGIVGSVFIRNTEFSREVADELLSLSITGLKDSPRIRRVEAQIMPFNNLNFTDIFVRNGFSNYSRFYLKLDLNRFSMERTTLSMGRLIPWNSSCFRQSAEIVQKSYANQRDALICSDYRTATGCKNYIRSIIDNPGCGLFMPEASFIGLDENNQPCGFVFGCCISDGTGMIPQIAVLPSHQGQKFGDALMQRCLERFQSLGFQSVTLTVTPENRKAYEWYSRLGFRNIKEFGAFIWDR